MNLLNQVLEITPENLIGMIDDYIKHYYIPNMLNFYGKKGDEEYEIVNLENRADVYAIESRRRIDIFLQNTHVGIFAIYPLNSLKSFVQFFTPECEFISIEQSLLSQMIDLKDFILGYINGSEIQLEEQIPQNVKRSRGANDGTLDKAKEGLEYWLDENKSINEASGLAGLDDQTMLRHIPDILDALGEAARNKWIARIVFLGKSKYLGRYLPE
jgi:hypothetical protein